MGHGLIWLWGHKRSSARVQVRAGVTWLGLQRGQQDVVRSLAGPAWCLTARYPLFLRRRAPRPLTESGSRPDDVVLHRPLTLVSSSPGTTSDGRIGAWGRTAWCLTARKPLFLRRGAPRHWPWSSLRRSRRGASPPANPCFFVKGHHVGWANRRSEPDGVVPHRPQTLISSSRDTTPLALVESSDEPAWCFTAR